MAFNTCFSFSRAWPLPSPHTTAILILSVCGFLPAIPGTGLVLSSAEFPTVIGCLKPVSFGRLEGYYRVKARSSSYPENGSGVNRPDLLAALQSPWAGAQEVVCMAVGR
jgi:hypothetical protein